MKMEYAITDKMFFTIERNSDIFSGGSGTVLWETRDDMEGDAIMVKSEQFDNERILDDYEEGLELIETASLNNMDAVIKHQYTTMTTST